MKSRILETLACIAAPLTVLVLVVTLSAVPSGTAEAKALSAGSSGSVSVPVSLPYVDDANPSAHGYELTVTCAGSAKAVLKASVGGKSLKVTKVRARLWTVEVPKGKEVKLSIRAGNSAWKSIGYRVY